MHISFCHIDFDISTNAYFGKLSTSQGAKLTSAGLLRLSLSTVQHIAVSEFIQILTICITNNNIIQMKSRVQHIYFVNRKSKIVNNIVSLRP